MDREQWLQYVLPLVVLAVVMTLRMRSMRKSRPLNLGRMWIVPALLVVLAVVTITARPPGSLGLAIGLAALAVGAAIGWHRGKLMRIDHHPVTGALTQTASPAAMILLLAIVAIRYGARAYFQTNGTAGQLDQHTLILTDALLLFAVGLISMTRVEMALRARRIIAGSAAGA